MFKYGTLVLSLLAVLELSTRRTAGYPSYASRLPNGGQVPHPCKPNYMWRGVGHTNALGGGERNSFGKDFLANGATWNEALCRADSDGDGLTNGQELGDPDCTWTQGALPNRTTSITHPGVCDPWNDPQCMQNNTWVECDVESFRCDALQNDPDVRNVTLRFPATQVPNTETNYFCMTFDLPDDREYHMVAYEPYIDNAEVMHHILVYGCEGDNAALSQPTACGMEAGSGCDELIALWQVGYTGYCMDPNVGFMFGSGAFTRIKMEFHWNNPQLRADFTDSSGMRFFYTPNLRANSAATLTVGQMFLEIPPLQPSVEVVGTCSSDCTRKIADRPVYVIQAANHMHYLGKSQKVEVFRNNELYATLSNDPVYSYDAPVSHKHNPPVQILPGDEIRTTCEFSSQYKTTTTYYGEATSDEMCFAFLTFYPREAINSTRNCVGYKEASTCRDRDEFKGCDFDTFLNASIPENRQTIQAISEHCQPFGPCVEECRAALQPIQDSPCLRGAAFQALKGYMINNYHSLYFLSQMMSCEPTPPCPECPTCPDNNNNNNNQDNNNNNNNNNNDNDVGDATTLAPRLISVVTLLMASLAFN
ncbi:tyramine beta-hydroxylase-like [Babylonia areolata]|uniref:tyramine beta-hydroxylase-like n=1 Tax=Babylonia areolata TaxID=304850 RepID=UPI003FD3B39C